MSSSEGGTRELKLVGREASSRRFCRERHVVFGPGIRRPAMRENSFRRHGLALKQVMGRACLDLGTRRARTWPCPSADSAVLKSFCGLQRCRAASITNSVLSPDDHVRRGAPAILVTRPALGGGKHRARRAVFVDRQSCSVHNAGPKWLFDHRLDGHGLAHSGRRSAVTGETLGRDWARHFGK